MHTYISIRRIAVLGSLVILLGILSLAIPASAASSNTSGQVTQSYNSGTLVLTSMLVQLEPKAKSTVIPLTYSDINNMLGVVVPNANATIVLTPANVTTQQVIIAPSGRYNVLVSDQNGSIANGNYLTMSAVPGIAMKADSSQSVIIGRAEGNFSGSNAISSVSLKNSQNSTVKVSIGRIIANIQLAPNPLYLKNSNSIFAFLTRAEFDVSNKPVSSLKTYVVGLVALATVFITGVVLYAGTSASITAIGRNPMAKRTISRGMFKAILAGLLVFAAGTAAVYLILNS